MLRGTRARSRRAQHRRHRPPPPRTAAACVRSRTPASKLAVFFITHNVEEAIFLSQRIVLMSPHPGQVQEIIRVDLAYPRDRGSPEFGALYARLTAALHSQQAGKEATVQ